MGFSDRSGVRQASYDRSMAELPAPLPLDEVDLSDMELWIGDRELREGAFRTLRDSPGLQFFPETVIDDSPIPPGPGYWALARHDDVWSVSRNPQLFCSGRG